MKTLKKKLLHSKKREKKSIKSRKWQTGKTIALSIRDKRQNIPGTKKLLKLRRKKLTTKFKISKIYKQVIKKFNVP